MRCAHRSTSPAGRAPSRRAAARDIRDRHSPSFRSCRRHGRSARAPVPSARPSPAPAAPACRTRPGSRRGARSVHPRHCRWRCAAPSRRPRRGCCGWTASRHARITDQLKAMGCSCDWSRQRFTMDEVCARAVQEAFFLLFRDELIYRGKRLVNWDPVLQTAVADDECYDEEVDGQFFYLRYPLVHEHGAASARERSQGKTGGDDAVPVTWGELRARGWLASNDPEHGDDEPAWVTVATTRPETYLGDTAVAVNPRDPRAKALRGLSVELPLVGRVIPIIEDDYVVLPASLQEDPKAAEADPKARFATGFLKVTPAHDENDHALWERHLPRFRHLPEQGRINIFAPDGRISTEHGWTDHGSADLFAGLRREEARKRVIEEFKARGLFEGSKPYRHSVPHSDRSKAIIEPYLSDQWYVRVTDPRLRDAANAALAPEQRSQAHSRGRPRVPTDGTMRFHPARYAKAFESWHDNIRDWCISRQLWWGHRIPVWHGAASSTGIAALRTKLDAWTAEGRVCVRWPSATGDGSVFACVRSADDSEAIMAMEAAGMTRDPDVLDTWFSSALWPLSTLGWPDPDQSPRTRGMLAAFNPTSVLSTAREIITLWVSRMVMFNRYFMGEGRGRGPAPFRDVFIHAVVQDGDGKRMSKSAGNGVDPLDIIATHGADALRFTLCQMATHTQDVRMPVTRDAATGRNTSAKFDMGRNFCNKVWNASRFAISILTAGGGDADGPKVDPAGHALSLTDRWMLTRLSHAAEEIGAHLAAFRFSEYAQTLYDLLWRDFCDWYLEAIKPTVAGDPSQRAVLAATLGTIVRLLHPVAPFVTEAIWTRLRDVRTRGVAGIDLPASTRSGLLCAAPWPRVSADLRDEVALREFGGLQQLVGAVREVRAQHNVAPKRKITLHLPPALRATISPNDLLIETLAGLGRITAEPAPHGSVAFQFATLECQLSDLAASVDTDAERARLQKLIADAEKAIATLSARLANPGYVERAPPAMVEQTRSQLARATSEVQAARAALERLG
ncbi:valine--tRNA ligase [Leptolyngbya sp. 15MV]|nr:valine--tRNA ligase [Leptolyngbya sp. 15MV]